MRLLEEDPLVFHGKISAWMAVEGLQAMAAARELFHEFNLPYYLFFGSDDNLVDPVTGEVFHETNSHVGST